MWHFPHSILKPSFVVHWALKTTKQQTWNLPFTANSTNDFLLYKSFYFPANLSLSLTVKKGTRTHAHQARSINKARDKSHNYAHSTHTCASTGARCARLPGLARIAANYYLISEMIIVINCRLRCPPRPRLGLQWWEHSHNFVSWGFFGSFDHNLFCVASPIFSGEEEYFVVFANVPWRCIFGGFPQKMTMMYQGREDKRDKMAHS